jgi:hypothetical protein
MRRKKDSALAVKYRIRDEITNIEGALHTFVTPVVRIAMHGDYRYNRGHGLVGFKADGQMQTARLVLLSAAVQPDFKNAEVMLRVCSLGRAEVKGKRLPVGFEILERREKIDGLKRAGYESMLRGHIIACLICEGRLPGLDKVKESTIDVKEAIEFLEVHILTPTLTISEIKGQYAKLRNGYVVSLELLCNSTVHQLRNKISALEVVAPQGYVYTSDPPLIFTAQVGATLLNRL